MVSDLDRVYQQLARSEEDLRSSYVKAAELYGRIMGDESTNLDDARADLCQLLGSVVDDATFWAAIIDFHATHDPDVERVMTLLSSGELAELEYRLLVERGMHDEIARSLVSTMQLAIRMWRRTPGGDAIENLRDRIGTLRKAECKAEPPEPPARVHEPRSPGRRFWRIARFAGLTLLVLGGAVTIVVNAAGAVEGLVDHESARDSIAGGASMIGVVLGGHEG